MRKCSLQVRHNSCKILQHFYVYVCHESWVVVLGQSLLPLLQSEQVKSHDTIFASHQMHEISMYYPMRVARTQNYKLTLNLNFKMPFPIDKDFAASDTFVDLLNRTRNHQDLHWFSTLQKYYYRPPFEFYDLQSDPRERHNLYNNTRYAADVRDLLTRLRNWQNATNDPWICSPFAVPTYNGGCTDLENSIPIPKFLKSELWLFPVIF